MDLFRKYLAGPQAGLEPTEAETVERLTDRVNSSTLLEDRRDAVRALKSLSKKFRYEVGTKSMNTLIAVMQTDRTDLEILGYTLDALCNIMSCDVDDESLLSLLASNIYEESSGFKSNGKLTLLFSEMFIKDTNNVSLLLSLLQEYDYHILLPTIHLLTVLLQNKTRDVQEIILTNPMGISKMMDLLADSREVVRNENMLLLYELTKGNTNIQKIVAFENAFEKLFEIIRDEGGSDGGVVVEDCLLVLLNLLRNNISNQNFLKEGSFIQRLPSYFDINDNSEHCITWPLQKTMNVCNMLKLIRLLVSPNNPLQHITSCQILMHNCGLLNNLSKMVLAVGIPVDALIETINAVAEIIRGNQQNQDFLASVLAPSVPPRSAIVVLLMSMLSDSRPFQLRCSVLYCFQSFLYKNELGQSQIIKTLLPSTSEVNQISSGQLLCTGLFNNDPLSTWFSAISLLHSIINNQDQKEQLLRVQLATSLGNTPVTLIQQCANMLSMGLRFQTRVGLLQLLCHWLADCSNGVTHFLLESSNVPYLISHVSSSEGDENEMIIRGLCAFLLGILVLFNNNQVHSFHKSDLRQIIEKRIGVEQYADMLSQVSKHESYSKASKAPNIMCNEPSEVIFDFEFTRLFKKLENEVLKAVTTTNDTDHDKNVQHDNIVEQYKLIIREQVNINLYMNAQMHLFIFCLYIHLKSNLFNYTFRIATTELLIIN
ncbi:hypothetical protein HELRODRAFT_69392 [Helobdella robusta]|uniref:Vesicle tethering protein Uso1/P115-like head domain-containing protein n=1 Tax=Helobdella robusta TaxID=6412 RepID=T1FZU6_HELRO|nr:hypothetical protein HELRODRAFT_69392 [Helobdella robusta]ESN92897.1 hypothetical protein HELRODRAFT_69392 [Helobdella robusta]